VGGAPHTVFHWEDCGGAGRPFATAVFPSPAKHGPCLTQALFLCHLPPDQHPGSHLFAPQSCREQETQRDRASVSWQPPFSLRSATRAGGEWIRERAESALRGNLARVLFRRNLVDFQSGRVFQKDTLSRRFKSTMVINDLSWYK